MTFTDSQGDEPVLTMAYDNMGRASTLTDSNNTKWVSSMQYDFAGRMQNLTYLTGNGSGGTSSVTETRGYDTVSGQMSTLSWSGAISGSVTYSYASGHNNGQITQVADTVSGETVIYQYDALKRLTCASSAAGNCVPNPSTGWTQTFQYDGFGNLTAKTLNGTTNTIAVNAATNRLVNANYDLNGNMTSGAGGSFTYDEANRMVSAQEVSGGVAYYGYGPGNKMVYRNTSSGQQIIFYGVHGEKLGVYRPQYGYPCDGSYPSIECLSGLTPVSTSIWFAGRLIMDSGNAVAQDRVGTNRANGARFYPFGDEITSTSNDREKFATYTRDSYTGLDYADQRFYASTYGRFNTPDPYIARVGPGDPGSWNRYSYTRGDPVNRIDPSGQDDCFPDDPLSCYSPEYVPGYCPPELQICADGSSYLDSSGDDFSLTNLPTECSGWSTETINPAAVVACLSSLFLTLPSLPATGPAQVAPPGCGVDFFTRPVGESLGIGSHQFLAVWGSLGASGVEDTLEGGPTNIGNTSNYGPLKAYDTVNGVAFPEDWPASPYGGGFHAISCAQADGLIKLDDGFSTTLTYNPLGTNSNSFIHWLITAGGLSSLYPTAPSGSFGWNAPVQPRAPIPGAPRTPR